MGRWSTETDPIEIRALPPRYTFDNPSPPHPVIYSGELNDLSRYTAMGQYGWSQAFPSSIWGKDPAITEDTYTAESTLAKSVAPAPAAPLPVASSSSSSYPSSVIRSGPSQVSRPVPCK